MITIWKFSVLLRSIWRMLFCNPCINVFFYAFGPLFTLLTTVMAAIWIKTTALPTHHKPILLLECLRAAHLLVMAVQEFFLPHPPPGFLLQGLQGLQGLLVGLVGLLVLRGQSSMRIQTCIHQLPPRLRADPSILLNLQLFLPSLKRTVFM